MKQRKCTSCGAPLESIGFNKFICPYCGSIYEDVDGTIRIVTVYPEPTATLKAECILGNEMRSVMDERTLSQIAMDGLERKLAEGLKEYLTLRVEEDPLRQALIIRGYVRVIPPSKRDLFPEDVR